MSTHALTIEVEGKNWVEIEERAERIASKYFGWAYRGKRAAEGSAEREAMWKDLEVSVWSIATPADVPGAALFRAKVVVKH